MLRAFPAVSTPFGVSNSTRGSGGAGGRIGRERWIRGKQDRMEIRSGRSKNKGLSERSPGRNARQRPPSRFFRHRGRLRDCLFEGSFSDSCHAPAVIRHTDCVTSRKFSALGLENRPASGQGFYAEGAIQLRGTIQDTVFDNGANLAHISYLGRRIAVYQDYVGKFAGLDTTQFLVTLHDACRAQRGQLQHFGGRNAGLFVELEFTGQSESRQRVGFRNDGDSCVVESPSHLQHLLERVAVTLIHARGDIEAAVQESAANLGGKAVRNGGVQGRHLS